MARLYRLIPALALLFGGSIACCLPPARGGFVHYDGQWHCPLPPADFVPADLVGTWRLLAAPSLVDILEIREDGTYRQTLQVAGLNYESPWQQWWMEYLPNGGIHVHFTGMRFTNGTDEDFYRLEGGAGDWSQFDPCQYTFVDMRGKVVLALVGTQEWGRGNPFLAAAPRGIGLLHMGDDGDAPGTWYILEEGQGN